MCSHGYGLSDNLQLTLISTDIAIILLLEIILLAITIFWKTDLSSENPCNVGVRISFSSMVLYSVVYCGISVCVGHFYMGFFV